MKMDTYEIEEGPQMIIRKIIENWSKIMVNAVLVFFLSSSSVSGEDADAAKRGASTMGWPSSSPGSCLASAGCPTQTALVGGLPWQHPMQVRIYMLRQQQCCT